METMVMAEGHTKHGALEQIHVRREGSIISKLQSPKTNQICGKQALLIFLEGLGESMSPSVPVQPEFQRQPRNHMSFFLHDQWCLMWVFIEPDNQIVLKSNWSHSLWALSSSFLKRMSSEALALPHESPPWRQAPWDGPQAPAAVKQQNSPFCYLQECGCSS